MYLNLETLSRDKHIELRLIVTWDVFEYTDVDSKTTGRPRLIVTWDVFEFLSDNFALVGSGD